MYHGSCFACRSGAELKNNLVVRLERSEGTGVRREEGGERREERGERRDRERRDRERRDRER